MHFFTEQTIKDRIGNINRINLKIYISKAIFVHCKPSRIPTHQKKITFKKRKERGVSLIGKTFFEVKIAKWLSAIVVPPVRRQ